MASWWLWSGLGRRTRYVFVACSAPPPSSLKTLSRHRLGTRVSGGCVNVLSPFSGLTFTLKPLTDLALKFACIKIMTMYYRAYFAHEPLPPSEQVIYALSSSGTLYRSGSFGITWCALNVRISMQHVCFVVLAVAKAFLALLCFRKFQRITWREQGVCWRDLYTAAGVYR